MWIIPKTLSAFVPDTEGLKLELDEQAWMCEQSATANGKLMSKQYWLRQLKKAGWIQRLSGLICPPSQHQSFVEKYVESLAATPASHFHQQASDKEKKTLDTSGLESENTPGQLEFNGFSPKMSKDTYRLDSPQSSAIWKKMVTRRRGEYLVRRKLVRHTKGSEFISWPTPRAGNPGSRKPGTGGRVLAEEAKKYAGHQGQGNFSTNGSHREQLSPDWVECLMGLPIGTSDLCCSATESSHKPQK